MAHLSAQEVQGLSRSEGAKQPPRLFHGTRCTCGGVVNRDLVCFRCYFNHGATPELRMSDQGSVPETNMG